MERFHSSGKDWIVSSQGKKHSPKSNKSHKGSLKVSSISRGEDYKKNEKEPLKVSLQKSSKI